MTARTDALAILQPTLAALRSEMASELPDVVPLLDVLTSQMIANVHMVDRLEAERDTWRRVALASLHGSAAELGEAIDAAIESGLDTGPPK